MVRLRVINPFLAVQYHDDKSSFYTLPVGSIIATGDDLWQPGLVHVWLRGQELLAFARDIKEHTEAFDLDVASDELEAESQTDSPPDRQGAKHRAHSGR